MILLTNTPGMDQDLELVGRFKRGDEDAFDTLFGRYKDLVYSLVLNTVGLDAADDVAQEVFVQVFRSLGRFRGESSLRTWIYRISINVCKEHIRKKSRQPVVSSILSDEVINTIEPVPDVNTRWTLSEVERAVNSLSEMERMALELHYTQGLSYREMAEALGCPTGTIKARIHDAVHKLRRKLHHLVEEGDV